MEKKIREKDLEKEANDFLKHLLVLCDFDKQIHTLFDPPYVKKRFGNCTLDKSNFSVLPTDSHSLPTSRSSSTLFWNTPFSNGEPLLHYQHKGKISSHETTKRSQLLRLIDVAILNLMNQVRHQCSRFSQTMLCDQLDGFLQWLSVIEVDSKNLEVRIPYFFSQNPFINMSELVHSLQKPIGFSLVNPKTWYWSQEETKRIGFPTVIPIIFHLYTVQDLQTFYKNMKDVANAFREVLLKLAELHAKRYLEKKPQLITTRKRKRE